MEYGQRGWGSALQQLQRQPATAQGCTPAPVHALMQQKAETEASSGGRAWEDSPRLVAQRQKMQTLFGPALQKRTVQPSMPSTFRTEEAGSRTGLPQQLKSGVEALSGFNMGHVRVHYNSSKPAQLNALAYAQGSDIHIGSGQEGHLPHEAWHVVQQIQGRVKPSFQSADGVDINDEEALEREADVMGSKAAGFALPPGGVEQESPVHSSSALQRRPVVQRDVISHSVENETALPPAQELIKELESSDGVVDTPMDNIRAKVLAKSQAKALQSVEVPTSIGFVLNDRAPEVPDRNGYYSSVIGAFGHDMFFMKTGQSEAFEGGHIVPHALWDKNDDKVEHADHYLNLVPMSRTLNVRNWANREKWMKDKVKTLKSDEALDVSVDIDRPGLVQLNVGDLASFYGLTKSASFHGGETVELYDWLPRGISLSYSRVDAISADIMSDDEFDPVGEGLCNTFSEITNGTELLEALRTSQFRTRISNDMWDKLLAL